MHADGGFTHNIWSDWEARLSAEGWTIEALGLGDALRLGPEGAPTLRSVAVDSRAVEAGALFVALQGVKDHGARFAPQAAGAGAAAILTDLPGALVARELLGGFPLPVLVVDNPRKRLADIARRLGGAQPETLVAVTGTNGKTSVASFAAQIFGALGRKSATFGTTGLFTWNLPADLVETQSHTTLEPLALHALLARLERQGVTHAAMEASSHGLAQYRVDGARLAAGALTNITRDHMDYHASPEDYAAAKLRLFAELLPAGAAAVLNADDAGFPAAEAIARARRLRVIPVGEAAEGPEALKILAEDADLSGLSIRFSHRGAEHRRKLALVGDFQGANALCAAALAIGAGEAPEAVFGALEGLAGVRGRMELVARRANGAGVFVDYAHTPDAIATAVAALRPHTPGRLHIVFGAGGDRDPGKRPEMGRAAASADRAIVTDDNPRSEDPAKIRAAILAACPEAAEIGDRAEAILAGVDGLGPGDALLIAGKGHEIGQTVAGTVHPFDDAEQARAAVLALDGEDGVIVER